MSRSMLLVTLTCLAAACGADTRDDHQHRVHDDGEAALRAAIGVFVQNGRGPEAFLELSNAVRTQLPSMDSRVAAEAELRLVVLALYPTRAGMEMSGTGPSDALALTVWPTLLAPAIVTETLESSRVRAAMDPLPGEDATGYMERLCRVQLAANCTRAGPEDRGTVIRALSVERALERVRSAVDACQACREDSPDWHQSVLAWEALERTTSARLLEVVTDVPPTGAPAGSVPHARRRVAWH